jgi:hypothetical protein
MPRSYLGAFPLLLVLAAACASGDPLGADRSALAEGAGQPLAVERLQPESVSFTFHSGMTDSARVVIRTETAWREAWQRLWATAQPKPPVPPVDFQRDLLVVAALGLRPTGGYGIVVDSAYRHADHVEVVIRKISPGSACIVTMATTQPVDVARLPATQQPVRFRERLEVRNCG